MLLLYCQCICEFWGINLLFITYFTFCRLSFAFVVRILLNRLLVENVKCIMRAASIPSNSMRVYCIQYTHTNILTITQTRICIQIKMKFIWKTEGKNMCDVRIIIIIMILMHAHAFSHTYTYIYFKTIVFNIVGIKHLFCEKGLVNNRAQLRKKKKIQFQFRWFQAHWVGRRKKNPLKNIGN